jgi:hypothetical protein
MPANRLLLVAAACLMAAAARAHHSFAAEFMADQTGTIEGVVTEVWFRNPHVRYYVEITLGDSSTESWDVRTSSPTQLSRRGWTQDTITEGDQVKVLGHLGRDGRKLLSLISIELADGTKLSVNY